MISVGNANGFSYFHVCSIRKLIFRLYSLYNARPCFFYSTSAANQNVPQKRTFSHIFQECSDRSALRPGKQAHARMILSGFVPTVFVANCLIQMYVKCFALGEAREVFEKMPQSDVVSWNTLIFGYAEAGKMEISRSFFDSMNYRDVITWNSLISGYLQNCDYIQAVDIFLQMVKTDFKFDSTTLAVILKSCSALEERAFGVQIHGVAVQKGFGNHVVTGSALVDMYAKCKDIESALRVFRDLPKKNWVSWSAAIAGCVHNDQCLKSLELFKEMQKQGIGMSQSSYASIFRSCGALSFLKLGTQFHGHSLKFHFQSDVVVGTATLDMYAKCDRLADARKLFNSMPINNLQSYNAIMVGYARKEQGFEALELFLRLHKSYLHFDEVSLSGAFCACAVIRRPLVGLQLHGLTSKTCLSSNICVANAILDMYGKCEALVDAFRVFHEMEWRDSVSWNAIIAACEQNEKLEETLWYFVLMLRSKMEPNDFTFGSVLKASIGKQDLQVGMEIHSRIIKSGMGLDLFVGSVLVNMYCKCGMIKEAEKIHHRLEEQTIVSWNAIISGFSLQNQSEDAQMLFSRMLNLGGNPDNFTYATVLDTCANLATVGLGKQIHTQIIKLKLLEDVYLCTALVDMYAKCGNMLDSMLMFEKAPNRDFVTWNTIICGCAHHGLGEETLKLFGDMIMENVEPNHATFISVLRACSHVGDVEKGLQYFSAMSNYYGLDPQLEHYSCMVDILGRAGRVNEALKLVQDMPFKPDSIIWRNLLSICKIQGNVEVAEKAAKSLLELEPQDSSAFILLSNLYADAGMWEHVSKLRQTMRCLKLKKEPGCSWIEVKNDVHTFLVGEKAHPECGEIYEVLDLLVYNIKRSSYGSDIDFLLDEEVDELNRQRKKTTSSGLRGEEVAMVSGSGICAKRVVVDARHHMLGRLASIAAEELLNGQKVVVVRC